MCNRWLVARGLDPGVTSCMLRHQMCPALVLKCGEAEVSLRGRSVGGLTGSRIAGFLGRIPVEAIAHERAPHWRLECVLLLQLG